ncbi:MAG TPA: hypothetical protein VF928_11370 [Usitatibacteraceae bacterium]
MAKHFLYLTNDKLVALLWKSGSIVGRDIFLANDAESASFIEYLGRHREVPTFLIVDLIEEDFRLDTIPHLRGGDSEAVLSRKLAQLYRATTFRHAIIQGREEEGRRDDKVLYHAITNPDLLLPWLAILERAQVPLEGIYSSPVLSGLLAKELEIFAAHTLLVTIVPDFGLRQTYFQNRQIKFSRLTQILYDESKSVGTLIAAEISRTWQYLDSLRFFTGGDSLEVCMLVHERDRPMIAEATRSFPLLKFRFLDINEVAAKIKLKPAPTSSHAEEVFAHLYAQGGPENHFAEPASRRFGTFRRARIGLYAFTAMTLTAGAAGAGFNLYQAAQISSEIEQQARTTSGMQKEYQAISTEMRTQTAASDTVRDASIFYGNQIRPAPAAPVAFLREFGDVLADFPDVQLIQIAWQASHDSNATPTIARTAQQGTLAVRSQVKAGAPGAGASGGTAAQATGDANPPLPGNKFQVVVVEAAIKPFAGDFRKANADINNFIEAINRRPGLKAGVVSMPLDTQTNTTIQGAVDDKQTTVNEARFMIRIVRALEAK